MTFIKKQIKEIFTYAEIHNYVENEKHNFITFELSGASFCFSDLRKLSEAFGTTDIYFELTTEDRAELNGDKWTVARLQVEIRLQANLRSK